MLQAKITALESYKITVLLEDMLKKLTFLDKLKSNMGDEGSEQNSEEITKAMDQQQSLEIQYANLVTRRGMLRGISQKQELQDTKDEIMSVSNTLRIQTKQLIKQLQDNPDVQGNQKLIKLHKVELCDIVEHVMREMEETQAYGQFSKKIEDDMKQQQKYEILRQEEKDYTQKIQKITVDLKKKQDDYAKEAGDSTEDITKYRKQLNETKIDIELSNKYTQRKITGILSQMDRLNKIKEAKVQDEIEYLKDDYKVEREVSERIIVFINKRTAETQKVSDKRDKLRDVQITKLLDDRQITVTKKEETDQEIDVLRQQCQEEEEVRLLHQQKDDESAAEERQKEKEKEDRLIAAKYIEKKWHWFQTEGKFLAKKRKKGKGKGGKKKKK